VQQSGHLAFHGGYELRVIFDQAAGEKHGLGIEEVEEIGDSLRQVLAEQSIGLLRGCIAASRELVDPERQSCVAGSVLGGGTAMLAELPDQGRGRDMASMQPTRPQLQGRPPTRRTL